MCGHRSCGDLEMSKLPDRQRGHVSATLTSLPAHREVDWTADLSAGELSLAGSVRPLETLEWSQGTERTRPSSLSARC